MQNPVQPVCHPSTPTCFAPGAILLFPLSFSDGWKSGRTWVHAYQDIFYALAYVEYDKHKVLAVFNDEVSAAAFLINTCGAQR